MGINTYQTEQFQNYNHVEVNYIVPLRKLNEAKIAKV